jgi:hypothetical protein
MIAVPNWRSFRSVRLAAVPEVTALTLQSSATEHSTSTDELTYLGTFSGRYRGEMLPCPDDSAIG